MLPAPTFDGILDRAEVFGEDRPLRDRLVSIVFAHPTSPVWADLRGNRAFLDTRTGESWDLFFAGMSGFAPNPGESNFISIWPGRRADVTSYFNPRNFDTIARRVEVGHAAAVQHADLPREPWRYGGGTTLVSLMVYGRNPDWLSLRDVPLYDVENRVLDLGHVAEGLRRWQEDHLDPDLAPGEALIRLDEGRSLLASALGWSASAVTAGVLGEAAFELMMKVLQ